MDLFTLVAKLSLDMSEYESGIENAKKYVDQFVKSVDKSVKAAKEAGDKAKEVGDKAKEAGDKAKKAGEKAKEVGDKAKEAGDKAKEAGDKAKKAADEPRKKWSLLKTSIDSTKGSFDAVGAKAVAVGTMMAHAIEIASRKIVDFGKSAIQNAADVAAEKAQFTATFAELQGSAEKTFKEIEKSTGVFGTRLKNVGTKAFSQFKGAGLDGVDALDMMKDYTNLAADAAAYYDISLEDADARLRSFLRGNTEAGDAIGLFTSESQRNSAAMEKYGNKWKDLTEAQKQMLMLDISKDIYKQSGAIGQAARESDQWTNVIGNLKEVWRQASGVFGAPIVAAITPAIKSVGDWLNEPDVQLKIEQFGLGVADAINWILDPKIPTWEEVKEGAQTTFDAISEGLKTAVNWTLGKLGMPDVETVLEDVENWWGGQGNNAYERIKSVLSWSFGEWIAPAAEEYTPAVQSWWNDTFMPNLTSIAQWTFGQLVAPAWADLMFSIKEWWDNSIKPNIKRVTTWDVGKAQWPSLSEMYASAQAWWNSVKSTISSIFTVVISPQYSYNHHFSQNDIDSAMEKYSDQVDAITSASKRAVGIDYVPFNDFAARLHEGEAVLTKAEATDWRRGGSGQSGSNADLLAELRALRQELAASRKVFTPDGRVLGDMVTEPVSQNIAAGSRSRRYSFG